MTIRKHGSWGRSAPLASDRPVVATDGALADALQEARSTGEVMPVFGLVGGDLCRTLGGPGDRERLCGVDARTFPIDVGIAELDGEPHLFVAHLIARRSWWWGRVVAVMNAQFLGLWDLGPRSHPNDGLLDISDGDISLSDRIRARKRLPSGSHLPHPGITTTRRREATFTLTRPMDVWLDGRQHRRISRVAVHVEPDAFEVVI